MTLNISINTKTTFSLVILVVAFFSIRTLAQGTYAMPSQGSTVSSCNIDLDLACTDPNLANGSATFPGMTWQTQSVGNRVALFNSASVQADPGGCYLFAEMMVTECGITDPVTVIYTSGPTTENLSFVTQPLVNASQTAGISADFTQYFSAGMAPTAVAQTPVQQSIQAATSLPTMVAAVSAPQVVATPDVVDVAPVVDTSLVVAPVDPVAAPQVAAASQVVATPQVVSVPNLAPVVVAAAPRAPAAVVAPTISPIYRLYNGSDYMMSTSQTEDVGGGYALQEIAFSMSSNAADGLVPLYRCWYGAGHFMSADANCEGQNIDGVLGYASPSATGSTTALYRFVDGNGTHLETIYPSEAQNLGMTQEGILGYVWPDGSSAPAPVAPLILTSIQQSIQSSLSLGSLVTTADVQAIQAAQAAAAQQAAQQAADQAAAQLAAQQAAAQAAAQLAAQQAAAQAAAQLAAQQAAAQAAAQLAAQQAAAAAAAAIPNLTPIYRLFNGADYLLSGSPTEGTSGGFVLQETAFSMSSNQATGLVPLYRCWYGRGHFMSTDANCEGQHIDGALGYAAPTQIAGTTPLYRFIDANGIHLETIYAIEGQYMTLEGVIGYVWANGSSAPAGPIGGPVAPLDSTISMDPNITINQY